MKRLLYPLLALMFISTVANASGQQSIWKCASAIKADDLNLARTHAADVIILSPIFGEAILTKAIGCLNFSFGNGWQYDNSTNSLVNNNDAANVIAAQFLSEDQNAAYYRISSNPIFETVLAKERLEAARQMNSVRIARANKRKEALKKVEDERLRLKVIEKQISCVRAKSSRTGTELDAINKRFEQSNKTLILNDTHEACTKVYSSDV